MPLFIDVQTTGGTLALADVAHVHAADLQTQGGYGAVHRGPTCMTGLGGAFLGPGDDRLEGRGGSDVPEGVGGNDVIIP